MAPKNSAAVILVWAVTVFLQPFPTSAELYKYIDNNGITRYTDNLTTIPPEYRQQLNLHAEPTEPEPAVKPEVPLEINVPLIAEQKTPEAPDTGVDAPALPDPAVSADATFSSEAKPLADATDATMVSLHEEPEEEKTGALREPGPESSAVENLPAEDSIAAPQPDRISEPTERVMETSLEKGHAERISHLGDLRDALEKKKTALDHQYREIAEERKRLDEHRQNLSSRHEIESYNQQVQQLNNKIQEYRHLRQTLESEVRAFNDSVK